jgi:cytochrome c peroxidase
MPPRVLSFATLFFRPASVPSRVRSALIHGCWSGATVLALSACGGVVDEGDPRTAAQSLSQRHKPRPPNGEQLFDQAFADSNGRSCSTCHVRAEHTVLSPANVSARLAANPLDPLFNRIDADDPLAAEPTFEHLKKGLVRVVLDLPDNMDLIDFAGNVVTPPERTVEVWRGVPTVENVAITAPYQYDGRRATLQEQAQGAITAHSEGPQVKRRELDAIAEFQEAQFSSDRARKVAKQLERGVPVTEIERPELHFRGLTAAQKRGLELYNVACEACHGGATTSLVVNREVHDLAFVQLKPDGNVLFDTTVQPPRAVLLAQPDNEFLNIGLANLSALGQVGFPLFNSSVALPRYRYRFYTDGSRTTKRVDLPPPPVTDPNNPFLPALDENGAPIFGPNFFPQLFSTDPGRAAITGEPQDFEAFDVPPLRGIANTAPYFHDNSAETLRDAVDIYSRFIVQFFPPLNLPLINPPEFEGGPPESFTPQQKQDLLDFLSVL